MTDRPDYQPKHLKVYDDSWTHCCFSGCTPMGCPGRCCVREMGHRASCPMNPFREFDEAEHDYYVSSGQRKHLFDAKDMTYHWNPALRRRRYFCPSCREEQSRPGSCGPSGCLNVPA